MEGRVLEQHRPPAGLGHFFCGRSAGDFAAVGHLALLPAQRGHKLHGIRGQRSCQALGVVRQQAEQLAAVFFARHGLEAVFAVALHHRHLQGLDHVGINALELLFKADRLKIHRPHQALALERGRHAQQLAIALDGGGAQQILEGQQGAGRAALGGVAGINLRKTDRPLAGRHHPQVVDDLALEITVHALERHGEAAGRFVLCIFLIRRLLHAREGQLRPLEVAFDLRAVTADGELGLHLLPAHRHFFVTQLACRHDQLHVVAAREAVHGGQRGGLRLGQQGARLGVQAFQRKARFHHGGRQRATGQRAVAHCAVHHHAQRLGCGLAGIGRGRRRPLQNHLGLRCEKSLLIVLRHHGLGAQHLAHFLQGFLVTGLRPLSQVPGGSPIGHHCQRHSGAQSCFLVHWIA